MSSWEAHAGYVRVVGVRLHHVVLGQGSPIVLIHGFGGWVFAWRFNLEPLSRRFRVHALDLKGFGRSDKPGGPVYDLDRQVDLLIAYLREVVGSPAGLVGHSLGGAIALSVAHQAPQLVTKLMLVDSIVPGVPLVLGRLGRLAARPRLGPLCVRLFLRPLFVRRTLRYVYGDPTRLTREAVVGYYEPIRSRGAGRALAGMLHSRLLGGQIPLREIEHEVRLLWGARDRIVPPEVGRQLQAALPRATLTELPGLGHVPAEEAPESFNAYVEAFFGPRDGPGRKRSMSPDAERECNHGDVGRKRE